MPSYRKLNKINPIKTLMAIGARNTVKLREVEQIHSSSNGILNKQYVMQRESWREQTLHLLTAEEEEGKEEEEEKAAAEEKEEAGDGEEEKEKAEGK